MIKFCAKVLFVLQTLTMSFAYAFDIPEGVVALTAPEVKRMVEDKNIPLIHVLSRIEYRMQHIPDSINIPVDNIRESTLMPSNKTQPIIFYCNGVACPYSRRASKVAVEMGYKQVYWFRGGILEWRKYQYEMIVDKELLKAEVRKLNPEKFRQEANNNVLILDVRPKWWRESKEQAGVIKGTDIMIPLISLDKKFELLPKDRPLLIVDRLMRQSVHAAKYLISKGFDVQGILLGGSKRWLSEGFPILEQPEEPEFSG